MRHAAVLLLAALALAGCGEDGGSGGGAPVPSAAANDPSFSAPERQEGRIDEAALEGFGVFFPPPLDGFTRGERFGKYVSEDQSTVTASYSNGSDHYSITICFSNQRVKEDRELKTDAKKREMYGFDLMTIAGYPALAQKEGSANTGATFLVDVSNSRSVSLLHKPGGGLSRANLLPMFEKIDFKGIAAK